MSMLYSRQGNRTTSGGEATQRRTLYLSLAVVSLMAALLLEDKMIGTALAGCFAALLAARIFIPILNEKQPRWYMAIGEWCIARLKPLIIALTRMLERLNERIR